MKGDQNIPGVPPPGVSREVDSQTGRYEQISRRGSSFSQAREAIEMTDDQHLKGGRRRRQKPVDPQRQQRRKRPRQSPHPRKQQKRVQRQQREEPQRPPREEPTLVHRPQHRKSDLLVSRSSTAHRPRSGQGGDTVALPPRRRSGMRTSYAFINGVDGREFQFKKMSSESKTAEATNYDLGMMSLIALVQIARGADPVDVLRAFKLRIVDENGQVFFDFRDLEEAPDQDAPFYEEGEEEYEEYDAVVDDLYAEEAYDSDYDRYDDYDDDDYYEGAGGVGY